MMNSRAEHTNANNENKADDTLPIAELYPELNFAQQAEAEYFLGRFLEVMHDIFEEKEAKKAELTSSDLNTTV